MHTDRRTFLHGLTAATAVVAPLLRGLARPRGGHLMYGLIAKLTAVPNKREELIKILEEGTKNMPGCRSYILAKRSEEHTSELQSLAYLVCRLLLEKKNKQ